MADMFEIAVNSRRYRYPLLYVVHYVLIHITDILSENIFQPSFHAMFWVDGIDIVYLPRMFRSASAIVNPLITPDMQRHNACNISRVCVVFTVIWRII
jgi:hypothetical protein